MKLFNYLKKIPKGLKWCLHEIGDFMERVAEAEYQSKMRMSGGWQPVNENLTKPPKGEPEAIEIETVSLCRLNDLRDLVHRKAVANGHFDCPLCDGSGVNDGIECSHCNGSGVNPNPNIGNLLMHTVAELGEAHTAHRSGKFANIEKFDTYQYFDGFNRETRFAGRFLECIKDSFEDELTDNLIMILDIMGAMKIDVEWHLQNKMKFNDTRDVRNGKKY